MRGSFARDLFRKVRKLSGSRQKIWRMTRFEGAASFPDHAQAFGGGEGVSAVVRLATIALCFGMSHWALPAAAASAKDCISSEDTDNEDALTYRNDCNRSVIFYYCVVDPKRSEVAPCRRVIYGTKRVLLQGSRAQLFLIQEMEPRTSYDIKLWGGSRIKWAACDAELGGLESFQPRGNAALDFAYECNE
jgi:hypothetical protein